MQQSISPAGLAPELARVLAQLPRVGDPAPGPAHRMRVLAAAAQHAARASTPAELAAVLEAAVPAAVRADRVELRLSGDDAAEPPHAESAAPRDGAPDTGALVRTVADGETVWGTLRVEGGPFTDEDEAAADAFAALAADALARIRMAARLQVAESSYRTLLDVTGDAIVVMDVDTLEILDTNRSNCELHGYTVEEFRSRTAPDLSSPRPEYAPENVVPLVHAALAGTPQRYEWATMTRAGEEIVWDAHLLRATLEGRDVLINIARDIRGRKAAEDALRRANEELEARVADRTQELGEANEALEEEVAEHEAAKEALMERTAEMEAIFRALPDLFFRLGDDGTVLDFRAGDAAVLAAAPEAFLWRRLHEVMPAHVMAVVDGAMARARETRSFASAEYVMDSADGPRDFEARIVPLRDGTFVAVVRDVTERAAAERALREREAHFRRMIENASDMVQIVGPDTLIAYTGPSMERLLGWTPEEIEGTSAMTYLHPDDVNPTLERFALMLATPGVPVQAAYRVAHKAGGYRWMEANAMTLAPDSGAQGVIVNARDVTERREFEEAMRRSEEKFRMLTEHSSDIPTIVSASGQVDYVSPSVIRVLGYEPHLLAGPDAMDIVHPEDLAATAGAMQAASADPEGTYRAQYRVRHADGSWRVMDTIVHKASAQPDAPLIANSRDITEQRRAEEALRASEEQFRMLTEHSSDVASIVSAAGESVYISPAVTRLLGFTPEELGSAEAAAAHTHPDDLPALMGLLHAAGADPSRMHSAQYRALHKDGSWRVMNTVARKISADPDAHLVCNTRDITEQTRAEEALRRSEEQFRLLTEHSSDLASIVDATGAPLYVSPAIHRLLGYTAEEISDMEFGASLIHPDDLGGLMGALEQAAADPSRSFSAQYRVRHRDGTERIHETVTRKVSPEAEAPLVCNSRDITEQKRAEEALRRSEERYRALIENSYDVITILDSAGNTVFQSPSMERTLGYRPEALQGVNAFDLVHPDDVPIVTEAMRGIMAAPGTTGQATYRYRHQDGSWRRLETFGRTLLPDSVEGGMVFNSRDVTDRWLAEEALREREEYFRGLIQNAQDLITVIGPDGTRRFESAAIRHLFGYEPEAGLGVPAWDRVHPDDVPAARRELDRVMESGGMATYEVRLRTASGEWRTLESKASLLTGRPEDGIVINSRDITDRVQAEQALRRSEEYFRGLIENAQDLITVLGPDGTRRFESSAARRLYGQSPDEALGTSAWDNVHPDDLERALEGMRTVIANPGTTVTVDLRFRAADGGWGYLECKARMLTDDPEDGIVVNSRDVTGRVRAEQALREREEFFRRLTENSNDVMQVCDASGIITYSAASSTSILGYAPEEVLGRSVLEFIHPDDMASSLQNLAAITGQPGHVATAEVRFLHASGEHRWMEAMGRTLDPRSLDSGIVFSLRDVRQRRAAQEAIRRSEEHFRRLTENASDMIAVLDAGGRFLYHSPSVHRVLGYSPEQIQSMDPMQITHPDDRELAAAALAAMCAEPGTTHRAEYRARHADGSWRVLESTGRTLLADSAAEGVVVNSRDVTERRAADEALRRATEEAERANRAKSEFLSRMSHELRTPMNSILGFAQILAELEMAPEDRKAVQHILSAGEHLLNLINEVLDIARIESGRQPLSLEPVQVGGVMREALDLVRPLAAARGISVAEPAGPALGRYVRADRQRLAQVLLNLLSNAVKYNRPGGAVRLGCRVVEGAGGPRLAVRVEDDGYGIAPEKQDQLFTPFARLGAEQSGIEGTGLGLTLSERLVGAMGGTLRLERSTARGSVFLLELEGAENPLDHADAPAEPADWASAAEGTPATLLYVEDNLANLSLIERVLMGRPEWKLLPALQGQLGVEMAREHVPDVVLLDLHLPDLSGEEVLRQLRADARTAHIPVIIISADATPRTLERLRADGAAAYLTKPLNVRLFLRTVDETLAARRGGG